MSFLTLADFGPLIFPTRVRIWQDEDCKDCSVTCDPPGYPTTKYIEDHLEAFMNPNLTNWASTKHKWPKNTLVDQCT